MQVTVNDASVTKIIKDGKLVQEIPVAPPSPAAAEEKQSAFGAEDPPANVETAIEDASASKSPKGGK